MRRIGSLLCVLVAFWGRRAYGQAQNTPEAQKIPVPTITAGFDISHALLDWQRGSLLRGCEESFVRSLKLQIGRSQVEAYATSNGWSDSVPSMPIPTATIAVGQQCLQRIGGLETLQPIELPVLLRLAIGINDDSLVRRVVARQLTIAGNTVRQRGLVLESAIHALLSNRWGKSPWGDVDHRSPAHDTLARSYAMQIDTMQPVAQVAATRMRVTRDLERVTPGWNIDTVVARAERTLRFVQSIPLQSIPPEDREEFEDAGNPEMFSLAQAMYLKAPTHANFLTMLARRDSALHNYSRAKSLLGHPAGRIDGYWFDVPTGTPHPVVPEPGKVTLVVFIDALQGLADRDDAKPVFTRLRQLHARYPGLQMVFVSITRGVFQGEVLRDQPEKEAERIHEYFRSTLQLPSELCVLRMEFHADSSVATVPVASPVLDRYHLDPRHIDSRFFLVDSQGWIVHDNGSVLDGHLIQSLLTR